MQTLKEEIRNKILDHSKLTFIKKGYEKTTMRDIADGSNISVGNIYRYFKNKDNILEELIKDFEGDFDKFIKLLDKEMTKNNNFPIVKKFTDGLLDLFEKHKTAINVLFQDGTNPKFLNLRHKITQIVSDRIYAGSKKYNTKNFNEVVCYAVATGVLSGLKSIINRFDAKINNFEELRKDLRTYVYIILNDLMKRLQTI